MHQYSYIERKQLVDKFFNKINQKIYKNGMFINCEHNELSIVCELKQICQKYIEQSDDNVIGYGGVLFFKEINRNIHYILPSNKKFTILFSIK